MTRELKKLKISRISIVFAGANRERFMIRKSVDMDEEEVDIGDLFPLCVPAHLIEKMERKKELEELQKQEFIDKGADPEDPYPSIRIYVPEHLIKKAEDDDDEDE